MNDVNVERVRSFLLRARAADGEELPAEHYCGLRTAGFPGARSHLFERRK